ncbi:hypothetical protein ACOSQ2_007177 [Xanthoceras sorbifolium]
MLKSGISVRGFSMLIIIPILDRTEFGRAGKLEKFSHYVARQQGFEDAKECPQLCKLAYDYLRKSKGCEDNVYEFFSNEPEAESLYVKLIEEFDKCIISYFAFHWSQAPFVISQEWQVLSAESEQKKPKLKNFVIAATRFCLGCPLRGGAAPSSFVLAISYGLVGSSRFCLDSPRDLRAKFLHLRPTILTENLNQMGRAVIPLTPPSTESQNKSGTKVGIVSISVGLVALEVEQGSLVEQCHLMEGVKDMGSQGSKNIVFNSESYAGKFACLLFFSPQTDDINGSFLGAEGVVASKQIPSDAEYGTRRKG